MSKTIEFYLDAVPVAQGSKRLMPKGGKKARRCFACGRCDMIMIESADKKLRPYRKTLTSAAVVAMGFRAPMAGGVLAVLSFVYKRPRSHFLTDGVRLTKAAPRHKSSAPDMDKLERAWGDAMTAARVWTDDAILVDVRKGKRWQRGPEDPPGIHVYIEELD